MRGGEARRNRTESWWFLSATFKQCKFLRAQKVSLFYKKEEKERRTVRFTPVRDLLSHLL